MIPIEQRLRELEPQWPATPDPWPAVMATLQPPRRRSLRPLTAAAAVLIAALALGGAIFAALPVVAKGLGIGTVDIRYGPIEEVAGVLDLGEPVEGNAGIPVPEVLGAPDATYEANGIGWLVYRPRPDLPEVLDTGLGALLAGIEGEALLDKVIDPTVTSRTDITVGGRPAVWLEGGSHELLVRSSDGRITSAQSRLAANTLLWVDEAFTYRLEVAVGLDTALRIAESMEP